MISGPFESMARERDEMAANPEAGMAFQEMYSFWIFVVAVDEQTVQVVRGGGHPSWFPECGKAETVPRADFPAYVQYEYPAGRRYEVAGWAERAEGLTIEQLERRIRETGSRRRAA